MEYGIHLPHAGEQASPALIRRFAIQAEELGLDDLWVSEHIIVPRDKFPRSPLFYDPVLTLTWAAAVTSRMSISVSGIIASRVSKSTPSPPAERLPGEC